MYRACYADGTELRVRHGRAAMTEEIRVVCGDRRRGGLRTLLRLADHPLRPRDADVHRAQLRLARSTSPRRCGRRSTSSASAASAGSRRSVGRYFDDERLRRIFSFQSMYAGLAPYEALAIYAVITYMDTVNGVFVPEGGMHALPVALATAAEKAGAAFRYGTRVDRILLARRHVGPGHRACDWRTARWSRPTPWSPTPTCPSPTARCCPGTPMPRAARRGAATRRRRVVWHVGVRGELPTGTAHHNIHFGRDWDGAFRAILRDGVRMPDPSLLVSVPIAARADDGARRGATRCTSSSPSPTSTATSTGPREREPRPRRPLRRPASGSATRPTIEVEELVDPLDWEAQGMERGTPFALVAPLPPDRAVPAAATSSSGRPAWCSPAPAPCPGVGVPMVLISGVLAAQRVAGDGGPDDRHARRELRAVPRAEQAATAPRTTGRRYALPRVKRHHVWALYAFCRHADDIVDDLGPVDVDVREKALDDFGDRFFADLDAGRSDDPVLKAVVHTVRAFDIDPDCFRRFLRSMAMDLTISAYATWDDLLGYMDGSAAVIGEMMLPILEPLDARRARAGARPRQRLPAHQLPPRRGRGPRPRARLPPAGGPRPVRRRSRSPHRRPGRGAR